MHDDGPVETVRAAVAALNDGDVEGYLRHCDAACLRWIAGFEQPLALAAVGEGLRQLRSAFDPLHLDEQVLFGADHLVCARWRLRGAHVGTYVGIEPTGVEVDLEQCEVYEVRGRRVVAVWTYLDPAALVRQLGAPAAGGAR